MKNHFFFHFTSHSILSVSCKCVCLCDAHCAYKEALALEQPPTPPHPPTIHSYRLKHNAPPSSPSPVFISPHSTLPTSSEPADLLPVQPVQQWMTVTSSQTMCVSVYVCVRARMYCSGRQVLFVHVEWTNLGLFKTSLEIIVYFSL